MNKHKFKQLLSLPLLTLCLSVLSVFSFNGVAASNDVELSSASAEIYSKGPQGGKLFRDGNFSIELTIFETGIPPEMRVFCYLDDKLIAPSSVALEIALNRLGNKTDNLSFVAEHDYLLSEQVVTEPHSFDIEIRASHEGKKYSWNTPSYEGRSEINSRILKLSNIELGNTGPHQLQFSRSLFGVVAIPNQAKAAIFSAYPSVVEKIHVNIGDKVTAGQVLATVLNQKTLQRYTIKSPIAGEITEWQASVGARVDSESFAEVAELSKVWLELSAFPEDIDELAVGQDVIVSDLHGHKKVSGKLSYIAPLMTGGHIARARVSIDNPEGDWRPGMHAKGKVLTRSKPVALAIDKRGLQEFRGNDVVFAKFGDTFEVRMLELGESDGEFIEVLGGIDSNVEYATKNSFLIKADVLKDGASHDH